MKCKVSEGKHEESDRAWARERLPSVRGKWWKSRIRANTTGSSFVPRFFVRRRPSVANFPRFLPTFPWLLPGIRSYRSINVAYFCFINIPDTLYPIERTRSRTVTRPLWRSFKSIKTGSSRWTSMSFIDATFNIDTQLSFKTRSGDRGVRHGRHPSVGSADGSSLRSQAVSSLAPHVP